MLTLPIFQVDRKKKSRMLKEKHMNLKGGREGGREERKLRQFTKNDGIPSDDVAP